MGKKKPLSNLSRVLSILAVVSIVLGVLNGLYHAYDILWPNQFVGDMYAMAVTSHIVVLIPPYLGLVLGVLLWTAGQNERAGWVRYSGQVLMVCAALVLLSSAVSLGRSRAAQEVRKGYPNLPSQELLRLAREEKDQFALDAIIIKGDPAAVPGLTEMLLDANEQGNLRCVAAHALGTIGGSEAKAALQKAKSIGAPVWLMDAVGYALEDLEKTRNRPTSGSP